jgi:hypothetical protein
MTNGRDPTAAHWMRARHFPRAIAAMWAWRAALAVLVAAPAAALVRQAFPSPPRGDSILWDPGAHALLVFVTREAHGIAALTVGIALVLAVAALAGIVPLAIVLVAIAHGGPERRHRRVSRTVAVATSRLPALVRLAVSVAIAQAVIAGAGLLVAHFAIGVTSDALGESRAQLLGGAVAAIFLPPVVVLGLAHDLARASVVRFRSGALGAFFAGARAWQRAPLSLGWAWAWRAGAGLLPVAVAAVFATRWGGQGGLVPLVGIALLHQGAVALRVALHVSWLAKTLRSAAA